MSSIAIQKEIDRINKAIVDLEKKVVTEDKKRLKLESDINRLNTQAIKATSTSMVQSYTRQASSKGNELNRVNKKINDYRMQVTRKQSELTRRTESLRRKLIEEQRKLDREADKRKRDELGHLKKREQSIKTQVDQQRRLTADLSDRSRLFAEQIATTDWTRESNLDSDFSLDELQELHQRVDSVLAKLNEIGLGQSILYDEIEGKRPTNPIYHT